MTQNDLITHIWTTQTIRTWPNNWVKYAVIGDPIAQSLSPAIHNASFRGLQGKHSQLEHYNYGKVHIKPSELPEAIRSLHEQNFQGLNVTIPHKVAVMKLLSEVDESAQKMGAVNTLMWQKNGYKGYNTDAHGLLQALKEDLNIHLEQTPVLIVGAGGAAQTAAAVCLQYGCPQVWITNRSQERLDNVIHFLKATYPERSKSLHAFLLTQTLPALLPKSKLLIIQSTSLGLHPQDSLPIRLNVFDSTCKLFDVIYNPWKTPLMSHAAQQGIESVNGLSMFIHQAALSFQIWTKIVPDVNLMRSIALSRLRPAVT